MSFQNGSLTAMLSVSEYINFIFYFLMAFGVVFQMPLVLMLLSLLGIVTPAFLSDKRKYAVLIIFVMAAILTPGPDVFSQLLLAVPMLVFYEIGIVFSRLAVYGGFSRGGHA